MRVTGGTVARLLLKVPRTSTLRPCTDRVRESLFAMLAPRLPGARILDLYSGTGAFAIEALSRGASAAVLVENNRASIAAIHENLQHTRLSDLCRVVPGDVSSYLRETRETFDLVLADPPYSKLRQPEPHIDALFPAVHRRLEKGGMFVLEYFAPNPPADPSPFRVVRERRYGNTGIWLLAEPDGPDDSAENRD